jgi:preprotein translocase subunit YajC
MKHLKNLTPGDKVVVHGEGHVTSVSSRKNQDGEEDNNLAIQLTSVGCECDSDGEFAEGFEKADTESEE